MNFTQEQLDIFDFVQNGTGHGIIDAVAGAGKTTTIMESVAYVPEGKSILFCAFNKSISNEISRKFREKGHNHIKVRTIHALGYGILKVNSSTGLPPRLEDKKYNNLIRTEAIQELLAPHFREIIRINNLDPDGVSDPQNKAAVRSLTYRITYRLLDINQKYRATLCKDVLEDFKKLVLHFGIFNSIEAGKSQFDEEVEQYFEAHRVLLREGNQLSKNSMIIDFTDMLYLPYEWKQYPHPTFDVVFIDECQDLSKSQLAVALKYAKSGARIMAVGDPRQSIYGFTGADIESFTRVRDITRARQLPLTTCFRCPQEIIQIAREIREDIQGSKNYPGVVRRIGHDEVTQIARPNDLIISRIKAPLLVLVFDFINKGIKVRIHEDEARDFLGELKILFRQEERQRRFSSFKGDFDELKGIVRNRRLFIINKDAERIVDQGERVIYIESEKAYLDQRLEFLHKKRVSWSSECRSVEDILKRIWEYITSTEESIKLSSIHRAKGLEENRIFILDYFSLPHTRLEIQDWEIIQEINLKYVAVTRAKEELYLVSNDHTQESQESGNLFDDLFEVN